jgi:hypothetical protein
VLRARDEDALTAFLALVSISMIFGMTWRKRQRYLPPENGRRVQRCAHAGRP